MLNKPRGIVTTTTDEKGRDTAYSLLPRDRSWLAPVGRLDKASEGLLLFTDDSEWAGRITDPASHLDKTYHIHIAAKASPQFIEALERGIETETGELLRAKRVSPLRSGEKNSWLEMIVEVLRLVRVAIGPLRLGDLAKGAHRPLRPEEKELLG